MRPILLFVVLALTLAGCSSSTNAPTPTTSTGAAPVAGGATSTPAVNASFTHDFSQGAEETKNFTLPVAGSYRLDVVFQGTAPAGNTQACAATTAKVVLKDPAGKETTYAPSNVATGSGECGGSSHDTKSLAAGAWTVTFSGQGVLTARVSVNPPG